MFVDVQTVENPLYARRSAWQGFFIWSHRKDRGCWLCRFSMKMVEVLVERFGYETVRNMTEGYSEWQQGEVLGKNSRHNETLNV